MKRLRPLGVFLPLGFFIFLLTDPAYAGEAVLSRTAFFVGRIFPAVFPAMCLSGMLVDSPLLAGLYRLPFGAEFTVWVLGMLCGFPVGARAALQLYEDGRITKKRAEFLCGFSNLASLPFLVGVVGSSLFEDPSFGMLLAVLQGVGSLIAAGVLYLCMRPSCGGVAVSDVWERPLLSHITAGTRTAGEVGGMLIFFGAAADCLTYLFHPAGGAGVLLTSLLEFSAGCGEAAVLGEGGKILAAVAVGFSGLCVMGQVAAVTKGKLSLAPYLAGKLIQTACMGGAALLFVLR